MDKSLQEIQRKHLVALGEGYYVERDVLRIVEKVREYDSALRVKFLAEASSLGDAPYCITEICKDGVERVVMFIWDLDDTVIERLYAADTQQFNVLGDLDAKNLQALANQNRRFREEQDQALDISKHILKSPKGTYSFTDEIDGQKRKVTVDDDPTSGPAKVEWTD